MSSIPQCSVAVWALEGALRTTALRLILVMGDSVSCGTAYIVICHRFLTFLTLGNQLLINYPWFNKWAWLACISFRYFIPLKRILLSLKG